MIAYDPIEGSFYWNARLMVEGETKKQRSVREAWNAQWAGKPVHMRKGKSPFSPCAYFTIRVVNKQISAQRVAWACMTGEWPENVVDHKNGDSLDNRWDNLRAATRSQNGANRVVSKNNRLGVKGVYQDKKTGMFVAQLKGVGIFGKSPLIGKFSSIEEAASAYECEARRMHGEFFCAGSRVQPVVMTA